MKYKYMLMTVALAVLILAGVLYLALKPITVQAQLTYDGGTINVLVADSLLERSHGLSGTHIDTLGADGMLFLFDDASVQTFWMNRMNYALDVIWIKDGEIMKISENISPPTTDSSEIARMSSSPFAVDKVLELPAGQASTRGLKVGMRLTVD